MNTEKLPVIHAVFETESNGWTGSTSANIKRVEPNDDGSITVVIDHWPRDQHQVAQLSKEPA